MAPSENNEQQQLSVDILLVVATTVFPVLLQEQINDFVVCKHYSGTLLLNEDITSNHGFGN